MTTDANKELENIKSDLADLKEDIGKLTAALADLGRERVGETAERISEKKEDLLDSLSLAEIREIMLEHYEDMLGFYGIETGLRAARKHLGWYVEQLTGTGREEVNGTNKASPLAEEMELAGWRRSFFEAESPVMVRTLIGRLFESLENHGAGERPAAKAENSASDGNIAGAGNFSGEALS